MGSITNNPPSNKYDVIIVGGGAAGIGAAAGARQADPSARILVVETEGCLGGAITHRGVVSFCGLFTLGEDPRLAVGGVWHDIRQKLRAIGGTKNEPCRHRGVFQVVEPESVKVVLDELLSELGVEVLLHASVVGAHREESLGTSVDIQERRGRRELFAHAFVDCSGDGDLAYHLGASTRYGNHGTVNLGSLATRFGGFSPDARPTAALWKQAIIEAKKTDPVFREKCRKNTSVQLRLPQSGDIVSFLASASYDARDAASITAAEISGRQQALMYLQVIRTLPGHENVYLVSTGPNFGTRESRHVNARYSLTKNDILSNVAFDDTIGLGAWGMEFHDENTDFWESTFTFPPAGTFQIPLRCLRSKDTSNFFVAGRCVDGDQYAGSAVRVMGTALATGQAAGTAAALFAHTGSLNVKEVQDCLRNNAAILEDSAISQMEVFGRL